MAARQSSVFVFFFAITTSSKDRRCLRPIGGDSCCPLVPGTQKLTYCRVCDLLFFVVFFLMAVVFRFQLAVEFCS